jgi:signal transduction histidine kinase
VALLSVPVTRDFIAVLFIPLSLEAVLHFGRRAGFLWIAAFCLLMAGPLIAIEEGPTVGLTMVAFYSGLCFLFGGYASQLRKAEATRRRNQTLIGKLHAAYRQLEGYVSQIEEISAEQERGRLARELHDSVTQTVFSMNLTVQGAILLLAREPARVDEQLARLEELAAGAIAEIQAVVSHLRPRPDVADGLPGALRRLAAERATQDGLRVSFEVDGERTLSGPAALALYAIVKEALNNVAKHAGTDRAILRLNLSDQGAFVEIEDNGAGFDPATVPGERGHLGLAGMADRAAEIGWQLTIDACPGQGARVRVEERSPEVVG